MPIYEYRCNACGHKLESLQRLSDAPLVTCPACGKDALAKQLSAAGFQLKGSGWYATDFKNSGSKPPAKDAAKPDAKADAPASAAERSQVGHLDRRQGGCARRVVRHQVEPRAKAKPAAPATSRPRPARRPEARDLAQGIGGGAEALPDRRASRLGSARHHHLGAAAAAVDARPDAAAGARERAPRSAVRIPHSRASARCWRLRF